MLREARSEATKLCESWLCFLINRYRCCCRCFPSQVYEIANTDKITPSQEKHARNNLKSRLNLFDLTFPQIVVSGYYVGGSDDLSLLIESGGLSDLLSNAKATPAQKVPYEPSLLKRSSTPDLCHVPKIRGAWYPHWPVYSFQVRVCKEQSDEGGRGARSERRTLFLTS